MTEAGWTSEKPTAEGWYWRKFLYCHVEHVEVCRVQKFGEIGGELGVWERGAVKDLTGLWLGPISPTDRQQGRVAGLREAANRLCYLSAQDACSGDVLNEFGWWLKEQVEPQQAQEGGVGDGN